MLDLLVHRAVDASLVKDAPQTDDHTGYAGQERRVVRSLVASQTIRTVAVSVGFDNRVAVVDAAVEQVEDVAAQHGRKRHYTPVLREAADAEGVGDQRWEDAKKEAVCDTGESGYNG